MTVPRVQVVIVNFNAGPVLAECLQRVLASDVSVQVTLVDNASSDGSIEALPAALMQDPRIALRRNTRNLGFAAANNLALQQAGADYRLLLNPDCLIEPDTLSHLLPQFARYPRAGMLGCRILNPDGGEQAGGRRRLPDLARGLRRALGGTRAGVDGMDLHRAPLPAEPVPVEAISGAFMLVRDTALREVGSLDEGYFLHCEDLDWCRRFQDAGWEVRFVPDVEVVHVKGACSVHRPVRVEFHKHAGMIRYYRKFLAREHAFLTNMLVYLAVWARYGVVAAHRTVTRFRGQRG